MKLFVHLVALMLLFSFQAEVCAQVVAEPAERTIRTARAGVTCIAISPKGDKMVVGLSKGAELIDLISGKKLFSFPYMEDGQQVVYYAAFNENGEYLVLIGHSGKRQVWDVKTGKQEKIITPFRWIPDARQVKAMGLDITNSAFDRYYQQAEAQHDSFKARAVKDGVVEFLDPEGQVVQKLAFPENKDVHHRAPCLFHEGRFITGTDDGRVLFYTLR